MDTIRGIHHVTAVASDPQRNLDFYTRVLGLRLVKLTVNFDANEVYHFYFADETGSPGTVWTTFPWVRARKGHHGTGQAAFTAFSVPAGSLDFWRARLKEAGLAVSAPFERFGEEGLAFSDPDGLQIELIASTGELPAAPWADGPVPGEVALRGFHGVTLLLDEFDRSARLLSDVFGLRLAGETTGRLRFEAPAGAPGRRIDLLRLPGAPLGRMGTGIVHHVAWRVPDGASQLEWRERLVNLGYEVTPVRDRSYFHSIYFNEPGGVLFELATDSPGFATDETVACLGSALKLPPWLEPRREEIRRGLPVLALPSACPEPA